ncbi:hypothetical protein SAMN05421670_3656 [Psychrobacillus psychrotolerans]|uniref:Uncharacterized protein n=1 Tax=Psychrobacillus psychrotolerans TaxID=126156 RepID=A0A1I6AVU0_9BACI|nr:hypothetical protein SAMN05421670_3656 [Psychrobacillus psychrotolerans]
MGIYHYDDIVTVPQEFSFSENIRYMLRSSNECLFEIRDDKVTKPIHRYGSIG